MHLAVEVAESLRGPVSDVHARARRLAKTFEQRGHDGMFRSAFGSSRENAILFLDDFHRLTLDQQRALFHEARRLREYGARSSVLRRVLVVIGGVIEWDRLDPERVSPFSNAATKIALPDFTRAETRAFARRRLAAEHTPEQSALIGTYVHDECHGHPYFVSRVLEILARLGPPDVNLRAVDDAILSFTTEGDDHLRGTREWLLDVGP